LQSWAVVADSFRDDELVLSPVLFVLEFAPVDFSKRFPFEYTSIELLMIILENINKIDIVRIRSIIKKPLLFFMLYQIAYELYKEMAEK
jgi:hypothetical protein